MIVLPWSDSSRNTLINAPNVSTFMKTYNVCDCSIVIVDYASLAL